MQEKKLSPRCTVQAPQVRSQIGVWTPASPSNCCTVKATTIANTATTATTAISHLLHIYLHPARLYRATNFSNINNRHHSLPNGTISNRNEARCKCSRSPRKRGLANMSTTTNLPLPLTHCTSTGTETAFRLRACARSFLARVCRRARARARRRAAAGLVAIVSGYQRAGVTGDRGGVACVDSSSRYSRWKAR